MSVDNPGYKIKRWSVVGMEGMWSKLFDPPQDSPETPEKLKPTNPVPEVMEKAGIIKVAVPHTVQRDLLHGLMLKTWDGKKEIMFYTFRDADNPEDNGSYPAATIRVPRGAIFHCATQGHGPPPHTIHWHGIEPTPMNDGVGHCSMEIAHYTYQWQPNFIGTYFYHCHRNTVQHFEFGLFGLLVIDPADAFFATMADSNIKPGRCRDGYFRTAANLTKFKQYPGFDPRPIDTPDEWTGKSDLKFKTDPHCMTVRYDVEALWVLDDRDSVWSDLAPDARATFPKTGNTPGVDDEFHGNAGGAAGGDDFFAFNDFRADYWFVTGVPVPAHQGGVGTLPEDAKITPAMNAAIESSQISVKAKVGDTILIRALCAAYDDAEVSFPVDAVVIAWDGRALGVPPFGMNEAYILKAYTPIHFSTARRFDVLIRADKEIHNFSTVKFIDPRGQVPGKDVKVLVTCKIPFNVVP